MSLKHPLLKLVLADISNSSNANEIPAVLWSLLHILLSENVTSRVVAELEDVFDPSSNTVNVKKACSGPLMNSIFMETMRLRSPGTVIRQCTVPDFRLGGWTLPKDSLVMATNWLAGRDTDFWNTGCRFADNRLQHPLDDFWAERFLTYPDDPTSGPIRKPGHSLQTLPPVVTAEKHADATRKSPEQTRHRLPKDDKQATLVTKGLTTHFFPFGGGCLHVSWPHVCQARSNGFHCSDFERLRD